MFVFFPAETRFKIGFVCLYLLCLQVVKSLIKVKKTYIYFFSYIYIFLYVKGISHQRSSMWKPVMMEQMMCWLSIESPQKSLLQVLPLSVPLNIKPLCPLVCYFASGTPRRPSETYVGTESFFLSLGI